MPDHLARDVQRAVYTVQIPHAVPQPVEPGRYRVTVGFETTERTVYEPTIVSAGIGAVSICETVQTATAEFELPDSGDVVVTVSLGAD